LGESISPVFISGGITMGRYLASIESMFSHESFEAETTIYIKDIYDSDLYMLDGKIINMIKVLMEDDSKEFINFVKYVEENKVKCNSNKHQHELRWFDLEFLLDYMPDIPKIKNIGKYSKMVKSLKKEILSDNVLRHKKYNYSKVYGMTQRHMFLYKSQNGEIISYELKCKSFKHNLQQIFFSKQELKELIYKTFDNINPEHLDLYLYDICLTSSSSDVQYLEIFYALDEFKDEDK
jgi:hypothetical protein